MINSIIACDNQDADLGTFLSQCKDIVISHIDSISEGKWNNLEINTAALNVVNIEMRTGALRQKSQRFIFTSFTHGSEDSLLSNGVPFIKSPFTQNVLENSLSYCFACSCGKSLGPSLIASGTISFIGYEKEVWIQLGYSQIFAECATQGLVSFYKGAKLNDAFQSKIQRYNDEIDNIYPKNFTVAALLMGNRDALVLHGAKDITLDDFIYASDN